ncbi:hypothetical protein FQN57_000239 [Myotisia sp. PD_48]|nr:hypothetical protein FQN57_000239 [Myotisia sp. PD_48]
MVLPIPRYLRDLLRPKSLSQLSLLASVCGLISTVAAVVPIEVQGSQFVNPKTNARFQMIGVDYQPGGSSGYKPASKSDVLSEADVCLRDAILLQRLGVNTIRIYNVNPALNHDECMSIYNAAGIYVILDVNTGEPLEHIDRTAPWTTYHKEYLGRLFHMIEAFKDYPNLLGFFGGNEIINEDAAENAAMYIRAIQRDMKDYIAKHASRKIPVGYSAADIREWLVDTWNYVSCELPSEPSSASDFFGLNSYSWCGDSSYKKAGYDKLVEIFSNASSPVFFSEYGCNEVKPRIFTEVQALYGDEMTAAMCGGLIYEYSQEKNQYGLVEIADDKVTLLVDYENLMQQHNKLDIKKLQSLDPTTTTVKPPQCKSSLITSKGFYKKFELPKRPEGGDDMIKNGVKNPNNGKIVEVKNTKLDSEVVDQDGNVLENLELKVLEDDAANVPGENTSGSTGGKGGDNGGDKKGDGKKSGAGMNFVTSPFTYLAAALSVFLMA